MAVTIDAATLSPLIGSDPDHAPRVLAVASARVLRYAPDAPDEIHNEAVIRLAGYLAQSDYGGISEETVGPMTVKRPVNHAAMFRNSGAAGLLAPWRTHRAGSVEETGPASREPADSGGDLFRWG